MHDAPHEHGHSAEKSPLTIRIVRKASGGLAPWNRGREPENWWQEIENRHGHVGPWNVLGYKMGRFILRELNSTWGAHEFIITAHIPLATPYSCILDGLAVATGNSEGRLDLLWAEVALPELIHVSVRRADSRALMMVLFPSPRYLEEIAQGTWQDLERQARECLDKNVEELFSARRFPA